MNRAPLSLIALACLLSLGGAAWAAKSGDDHAAPAKPSAHAAQPKAEPRAAAAAPASMDQLRDKLAERLGAVKAPDANNPNVLRVANKAEPAESGQISVHGAGPLPSRKAKTAHAAPEAGGHAAPGAAAAANAAHGAGHGGEAHWAYNGDTGPETWGRMKPEFSKCSTGNRQSPIDIRSGIQVQLAPIQFEYQPTGFSVIDNGHTVQVNLPAGNSLTVNSRRYDLLQFHFHRPSEERVNGRQFDMVVHLVHKDLEGRLAVVAVLLERGGAQSL
ncbi:carbonic anhydrase family protein, partial [Ideonella sp.]|uniref:carbonic anhydrase family protein n=1 Tax=Ideonella sp. TaxID=1929293 RepID=UPI003BB7E763